MFVTHFIVPHLHFLPQQMPSLEFSKGKDSDDNNVGSHVFCVPRALLMFHPAQSPPLSDGASAGIIIVDS